MIFLPVADVWESLDTTSPRPYLDPVPHKFAPRTRPGLGKEAFNSGRFPRRTFRVPRWASFHVNDGQCNKVSTKTLSLLRTESYGDMGDEDSIRSLIDAQRTASIVSDQREVVVMATLLFQASLYTPD